MVRFFYYDPLLKRFQYRNKIFKKIFQKSIDKSCLRVYNEYENKFETFQVYVTHGVFSNIFIFYQEL